MSTINSTSTLAEVWAAYDDNASFEEDGDSNKARAFLTACRILLRRMPAETGNTSMHTKLNPELIYKDMDRCQQWLQANPGTTPSASDAGPAGPRVTRADFSFFRN